MPTTPTNHCRVRTSGRTIMAGTPDAYVVVFTLTSDRHWPWDAAAAVSVTGQGILARY